MIALIGGGAFGATEGRVLLTTLLVGVASVAVLCYLATAGTPYQWVGVVGGVVLVAPVVTALFMIWHDFDTARRGSVQDLRGRHDRGRHPGPGLPAAGAGRARPAAWSAASSSARWRSPRSSPA